MKISTRRRVIAAAFAALAISAVTATSANAAAFPVLHGGNSGQGQEAHTCVVLGTDGTTDGVVCIDLLTGLANTPSGPAESGSDQVEAYCQNHVTAVIVRCANVEVKHSIANGTGQEIARTNNCGHAAGDCSSGRNIWRGGAFDFPQYSPTQCTASADQPNQDWAIFYGGAATTIELPQSDKPVQLQDGSGNDGVNESTGHYFVCV